MRLSRFLLSFAFPLITLLLGACSGCEEEPFAHPDASDDGGDKGGSSRANFNEYYPAFSPDSRLITFTGAPHGGSAYNNGNAEIFVVPSGGAEEPIRLRANDPPACTGRTSPGVTNSWSKWAPRVSEHQGKRYDFLTFSSTRREGGIHQLYLTAIVDDGEALHTFPALHLWNQIPDEGNHTPAWEEFFIPIVIPG